MACVLVDVLDIVNIFSAMCQSEDEGDLGILPELATPGPTSPTIFRESTCSQESPQTTIFTEDSNEVGMLHLIYEKKHISNIQNYEHELCEGVLSN